MATQMASLATHINAGERRTIERVDVAIWTRIRVAGQADFPARIGNMSATGFMVATPCPVYDYAVLEIELPRIGWVRATALWSLGDKIGGEFEQEMTPEDFSKLRPFLG